MRNVRTTSLHFRQMTRQGWRFCGHAAAYNLREARTRAQKFAANRGLVAPPAGCQWQIWANGMIVAAIGKTMMLARPTARMLRSRGGGQDCRDAARGNCAWPLLHSTGGAGGSFGLGAAVDLARPGGGNSWRLGRQINRVSAVLRLGQSAPRVWQIAHRCNKPDTARKSQIADFGGGYGGTGLSGTRGQAEPSRGEYADQRFRSSGRARRRGGWDRCGRSASVAGGYSASWHRLAGCGGAGAASANHSGLHGFGRSRGCAER